MEEEIKNQKPKNGKRERKKVKQEPHETPAEIKNQHIHHDASPHQSDASSSSQGWSSEVIEPALKTMNFRKKRGTRMKELIKGKPRKDHFWDKYQDYFGGDLNKPGDSDQEEDYEASSSGRDQFDSDFDLTDSYVGKRGRKKGTKIKKRKRAAPKPQEDNPDGVPKVKGKRGRKKKVPAEVVQVQKPEILLKEEKNEEDKESKEIFKDQNKVKDLNVNQQIPPNLSTMKEENPELMIQEEVDKQQLEANIVQNEQHIQNKMSKEEDHQSQKMID